MTAGFDPLRDEGRAYADRLADAGVDVEQWCYEDQIHGFFCNTVFPSSLAASVDACRRFAALLNRTESPK